MGPDIGFQPRTNGNYITWAKLRRRLCNTRIDGIIVGTELLLLDKLHQVIHDGKQLLAYQIVAITPYKEKGRIGIKVAN